MKNFWLSVAVWMIGPVSVNAACTGASPTWTCVPGLTNLNVDIDNLINHQTPPGFKRNDTINVTAGQGTTTWPSEVDISFGVQIKGPGASSLTITQNCASSCRAISFLPDATAGANNEIFRLSGFTWDMNNVAEQVLDIISNGLFRNLAIHDNVMKNQAVTNNIGQAGIYAVGQVRGVVARNTFDRFTSPIRAFGWDTCTEWTNGNYPFAYGNGDNLFFESNRITYSSPYAGSNGPGWIETGQSGRLVTRYNTWDYSGLGSANISTVNGENNDRHGFQNFDASPNPGTCDNNYGQTGTMITEHYGNTTLNKGNSYRDFDHRGSWLMIHNNVVTTLSGQGQIQLNQYDGGCNSFVAGSSLNGQINNTYGFNNLSNGSDSPMVPIVYGPFVKGGATVNNICPPIANQDYWNLDAGNCTASSCTQGIGRGTTPPTGSCTAGVGYWVAGTPTPTSDPNVIQNGTLYKCAAPNTWTAYYRPYTYPHPLLSSAIVTSAPSKPVGLALR